MAVSEHHDYWTAYLASAIPGSLATEPPEGNVLRRALAEIPTIPCLLARAARGNQEGSMMMMTTTTEIKPCESCGEDIWVDTDWPSLPFPSRNARDNMLHSCPTEFLGMEKLLDLKDRISKLGDMIDNVKMVPERYQESAKGLLAEAHVDAIRRAEMVVFRLLLWQQHPTVSPESYLRSDDDEEADV